MNSTVHHDTYLFLFVKNYRMRDRIDSKDLHWKRKSRLEALRMPQEDVAVCLFMCAAMKFYSSCISLLNPFSSSYPGNFIECRQDPLVHSCVLEPHTTLVGLWWYSFEPLYTYAMHREHLEMNTDCALERTWPTSSSLETCVRSLIGI